MLRPRRLAAWLPSGTPSVLAESTTGFTEHSTLYDRLDLMSRVSDVARATLPEIPLLSAGSAPDRS